MIINDDNKIYYSETTTTGEMTSPSPFAPISYRYPVSGRPPPRNRRRRRRSPAPQRRASDDPAGLRPPSVAPFQSRQIRRVAAALAAVVVVLAVPLKSPCRVFILS